MPKLQIDGQQLTVKLTTLEKFLAVHGNLRVPLDAIASVEVLADALPLSRSRQSGTRGLRMPGSNLPGLRAGTWRSPGAKSFVFVRRNQPTLRIELRDADFTELLISTPDAQTLADQLKAAVH